MRGMLLIAAYDLLRLLKDRQAFLWQLVLPILFAFIFGSVMQGSPGADIWIPIFDHDQSPVSELFIEAMRGEGYGVDVRAATEEVYLPNWPAGIVIPATFSTTIASGTTARLEFVEGNDIERSIAIQARMGYALVRLTTAMMQADLLSGPDDAGRLEAMRAYMAQAPSIQLAQPGHASLKPPPMGFARSLPGFLVLFVLQMTVIFGGVVLVNDRQEGAFGRLAATPLSTTAIFAGKSLARLIQAGLQAFLLLLAGWLLFGISLGNAPLALAVVIIAFAAFASSLGILVGLLCQEEQQVITLGIALALGLAALGGCWWPIEIVPSFFQQIAYATPTYWALRGIQDVTYFEKGLMDILPSLGVLGGYTLGLIACMTPLMKRYRA